MQLDLKKRPLGQYLSRHLLFEEWDPQGKGWAKGLYLALAQETTSMFASTVDRSAGFIRLEPTVNGAAADYTVTADPSCAKVSVAGGGSLTLALDGPAILIAGEGAGLILRIRLGSGETVRETERGKELFMGGTRYIIKPVVGEVKLEVTWQLTALRSSDPVLTFTPAEGRLAIEIIDSSSAYDYREYVHTPAEAAAGAEKAFATFAKGLSDPLLAYDLWIGFQTRRGRRLVLGNPIRDQKAYALDQAFAALALKDTGEKVKLLSDLFALATPGGMVPAWAKESAIIPEAAPPIYGAALLGADFAALDKGVLKAFRDSFAKVTEWWFRERSAGDACFYAYPHECGLTGKPAFPAPRPCVSPDLLTYLSLCCTALADICKALGEDASLWTGRQEKLNKALLGLWNGKAFMCRDALNGETAPAPKLLGVMPLLLGDQLPADLQKALLAAAEGIDPAEQASLLPGLAALNCPALAKKLLAAGGEQADAPSAAAFDPARSALLLALQERS